MRELPLVLIIPLKLLFQFALYSLFLLLPQRSPTDARIALPSVHLMRSISSLDNIMAEDSFVDSSSVSPDIRKNFRRRLLLSSVARLAFESNFEYDCGCL